jgi:sugar lactone lactonase YvrE
MVMIEKILRNRSHLWKHAAQTLLLSLVLLLRASAQGPVLNLSPGGTIHTVAGNGQSAFAGDGGLATSAALALPFALAADGSGNIYFADMNNHRIRRIDANGNITTVAGNGQQGFFGDGGSATSAALNHPSAVALDVSGNLYIADSGNHRVRIVSNGTIATFAGNGTAAFSGDGGAAISASLNFPRGVVVDGGGNVYIADTNNQRIRKVTGSVISSIAGNGEQDFTGDGGPATSASLDTPTAVAVDTIGNLLIADSNNHRIRKVTAGTITTLAGNGSAAFTGDGGPATSATLAYPLGVSTDSAGNVYIADSDNHVIRRISPGGIIATVAANGEQGFFGDQGPPTAAVMDTPTGVLSVNGNLYIADKNNERIRRVDSTMLAFGTQVVGTSSAVQTVTVKNSGGSTLTIASLTSTPVDFALAASGSCGTSLPINVAAGASCTLDIIFVPAAVGARSGSLAISDNAEGSPHAILVNGTGLQDGTSVSASSAPASPSFGDSVTITATLTSVVSTAAPPPTGTVTFSEGATVLSTQAVSANTASFVTTTLSAGSHTITATYSGDSLYVGSSASFTQVVTKAIPALSWTSPASITYGTQLGTAQLNATASVPGTFVYSPSIGTLFNAGVQTLSVTFTPTDTVDYTTAITSVSLTVNKAPTTTSLTSSLQSVGVGASVTFTATITSSGGIPAGAVNFVEGNTVLSIATLSGGTATFVTSSLPQGTHLITAVYVGSSNFLGSNSNTLSEAIGPTDFTLTPVMNGGGGSAAPVIVQAGQAASVPMMVSSIGSPGAQIQFSVTGLPPSSSATFNPAMLTLGTTSTALTLTVTTQPRFRYVSQREGQHPYVFFAEITGLPLIGLTLFGAGLVKRSGRMRRLWLVLIVLMTPAFFCNGCASADNYRSFGTPAGTYPLVVTATSGTTQHTLNTTLVVR